MKHKKYIDSLANLCISELKIKGCTWPPHIKVTWNQREAFLESEDGKKRISITNHGRISISFQRRRP